ncbi:MAG TPA: type III-B CRISPR-associated protein Cas10/Cmr2 [Oscillatoriaceae cyanobacterium M33_DOE_052]|uniref:Type III-B CRISPR-associated protein Cas10/Cmr2 n=1 Tax=Planktothricoides sp. SpSt-374 TaxID=2282167 RepID=A0A7C3VP14_9CYAN|nr:type III-B CRISPR-associated protein Cas10/Cmr2 [Oscillatoriaceae cyanobacterium M33_DOE_052]
MNLYYHRKLYALLAKLNLLAAVNDCKALSSHQADLALWWQHWENGIDGVQDGIDGISKASDRVALEAFAKTPTEDQVKVKVKHLISGQSQDVGPLPKLSNDVIAQLNQVAGTNARKAFWWLWRFYPEFLLEHQSDALLFPADRTIPDCPLHSYYSTVTAIAGALHSYYSTVTAIAGAIPPDYQKTDPNKHPYLLLFTFSPVQEFIKSSRKFVDFWAGSYLLHYLSARLCWSIARIYGPDAVITPSLWSQEIIDALIVKSYPNFGATFANLGDGLTPAQRFNDKTSISLSTAGFPNVITAIVPGKQAAEKLGKQLSQHLTTLWRRIAYQVRDIIRNDTIKYLENNQHQDKEKEKVDALVKRLAQAENLADSSDNPNRRDLEKWQKPSCWEWNKLWEAQINHTWEPYWTAMPLGYPEQQLTIHEQANGAFDQTWKDNQETVAPSRFDQPTPTTAEETFYHDLNIGTWWGNVQSRLGNAIQAVKNTRSWQIPTAPGERSTISGQFSALHPSFNYGIKERTPGNLVDLREGAGLSSGSMQLFWGLMALVYPGLFNGSEKLNALELTKRMAWVYGGVAKSLGIDLDAELRKRPDIRDYEQFIRFPNLSSIASARFAADRPDLVRRYLRTLSRHISEPPQFEEKERKAFFAKTLRLSQVPKTDAAIHDQLKKRYNGVMFSSKWLADDMGLNDVGATELRRLVAQAHKDCGFGDNSPADWWVIVLADGDGMGQYVTGRKLKSYDAYIDKTAVHIPPEQQATFAELLETRKRMGPATHVGLNRALLDFSNRLVPYITEQRFCGKVVYSGGDDVMAVLPLADLPEFLLSLRAAWCGSRDPKDEFVSQGGYWLPGQNLGHRPLFTMGEGATMSMGIVVAHKSVPLPTVLETLWEAEKERAKKLPGTKEIPAKDGLCFRVIYGGGNVLEALMKGHLLPSWWQLIKDYPTAAEGLSPVFYRLAEELPKHAFVTPCNRLFSKAAKVILMRRDNPLPENQQLAIMAWLDEWEDWAKNAGQKSDEKPIGTSEQDLSRLLRFTAFWLDKMALLNDWIEEE